MFKMILSVLSFGVLISSCFAGNYYTVFSHASGTFSLEVNHETCVGLFKFNEPLWISTEKLSEYCSTNDYCPIAVYKGENCRNDGTQIGKGYTEITSGKTVMENLKTTVYFFSTGEYSLGLHPQIPPG